MASGGGTSPRPSSAAAPATARCTSTEISVSVIPVGPPRLGGRLVDELLGQLDQLVGVEGLGDVGGDAEAEAAGTVLLLGPGGEEDHGDARGVGVGLEPLAYLPPVQPG